MKKLLALLLAATVAVSISACSGDDTPAVVDDRDAVKAEQEEEIEVETETSVSVSTGANTEDTSATPSASTSSTPSVSTSSSASTETATTTPSVSTSTSATTTTTTTTTSSSTSTSTSSSSKTDTATTGILANLSSVVLIDNDVCKITITGVEQQKYYDYPHIKFSLENKTSDTTLKFSTGDCYVDGYECYLSMYEDVSAGKKSNYKMSFNPDMLTKYGLTTVNSIQFEFIVKSTTASYSDPALVEETVIVYPNGQGGSDFVIDSSKITNVLVDNEYLKVYTLDFYTDNSGDFTMDIVYEIKSADVYTVQLKDSSVNGYMIDAYGEYYLSYPVQGTKIIGDVYWPKSKLTENDITSISDVEFDIVVKDHDYDEVSSTPVKLTVTPVG